MKTRKEELQEYKDNCKKSIKYTVDFIGIIICAVITVIAGFAALYIILWIASLVFKVIDHVLPITP